MPARRTILLCGACANSATITAATKAGNASKWLRCDQSARRRHPTRVFQAGPRRVIVDPARLGQAAGEVWQQGQNLVQNFVLYTPPIHLVSAGKQRLRHGEAERGLEVSYERVRSATAAAAPPGHVSWTVSADHPDFHRRLAPGTAARPIAIR